MIPLKNYVEFVKGSIPLIISVPHGGSIKKIKGVPTRKKGIIGTDKNTIGLARELIKEIKTLCQSNSSKLRKPSLVILRVHRSKIDINRRKNEAFDKKSNLARNIYQFYHDKVRELIDYNLKQFNRSLLIDIHGFEKEDIPEGYRDVELILGTNNLKTLFSENIPKRDWAKNIRGVIIKKFVKLGIPIAPGHQRRREYALIGGYITQHYGASKIKNSQTIQIEFSDKVRLYDGGLRKKVIKALAEIICKDYLRVIKDKT